MGDDRNACRMIKIAASLAILLVAAAPAHAQSRCRVVDGDTLRCGAERVRIIGLDAPEMRGECPREIRAARAATARMAQLIEPGITLERRGNDRYRRTLAVVRDRSGRDLAVVMIREGHARPYNGRGRRGGWCDVR